MKKYIQGDVILRQIKVLPEGLTVLKSSTPKAKILQKSEVTGHHHQFAPTAVVDMYTSSRNIEALTNLDFTTITPNEGKYIVVDQTTQLFHGKDFDFSPFAKGTGDHNALTIEPGIYEIDIVREYNYELNETRRVID